MMKCYLCDSAKGPRACDECAKPVCRSCAIFLEKESFRYHPKPPKILQRSHFCFQCHEALVVPELEAYQEVKRRADDVTVVTKAFRGVVPYKKKVHELEKVKDHLDEKEAVYHLAFLAAWNGFDSILGVETEWKKVRRHGYEHKEWVAKGYFALLDHRRFRPDG